MSDVQQQYIPDSSGSLFVAGHEELALSFALKDSFLRRLEEEAAVLKRQLRDAATAAVLAAGAASAQVRRVFIRNGQRGGVGVSLPDYTKDGNRLVLSDSKMSDIGREGDLSTVGIPLSDLIEETTTDPGGEVIELRGRWVSWFRQHMGAYLEGPADPDIKWEKRDKVVVRRLRPSAVNALRAVAAGGNLVAAALLSLGLKDMSVKAEDK